MSLSIHRLVNENLPLRRRQTPKGWILFDAVCCHHRGHNKDTRSRGNLLNLEDGTLIYNCYNCGFKTRYMGGDITNKFETFLGYLGISNEVIKEIKLDILRKKLRGELPTLQKFDWTRASEFKEIPLPEGTISIDKYTGIDNNFVSCVKYLQSRGPGIASSYRYYWNPSTKWDLNKRIIIPFYHADKIVGWTARYAGTPPSKDVPRYFNSEVQAGYLFNNEVINRRNRKYIIIVEGPFDAIAIDCISPLGSTMNAAQIDWLNSVDSEKIVLPDRQLKNQGLIDIAKENNWSVSFPEWEDDIKDAADAQKRYGQLYTLTSVIKARTDNHLQIELKRQLFKED